MCVANLQFSWVDQLDLTSCSQPIYFFDDGLGVDAEVPVKVGDGSGLSEVLDTERDRLMPMHGTQPRECGGMPVDDRDQPAMAW